MIDVFTHIQQLCDEYDEVKLDPRAAVETSARFAHEARELLPLLADVAHAASDHIETTRVEGWPLLGWREEVDRTLATSLAHLEHHAQERGAAAASA